MKHLFIWLLLCVSIANSYELQERLLCPKCKELGLKSRVYQGTTSGTLMYSPPYYDEDGTFHHNDPNIYTTDYWCSQGHTFYIRRQRGSVETVVTSTCALNVLYDLMTKTTDAFYIMSSTGNFNTGNLNFEDGTVIQSIIKRRKKK